MSICVISVFFTVLSYRAPGINDKSNADNDLRSLNISVELLKILFKFSKTLRNVMDNTHLKIMLLIIEKNLPFAVMELHRSLSS